VAVYLFFVWLLHVRPHQRGVLLFVFPAVTALVLLTPLGPAPIEVLAALLTGLVAVNVRLGRRVPDPIG